MIKDPKTKFNSQLRKKNAYTIVSNCAEKMYFEEFANVIQQLKRKKMPQVW